MYLANNALADKRKAFLRGIIYGLDLPEAARRAGIANAARDAYEVLYSHEGMLFIQENIKGRLITEGLPLAWHVALELLGDEKISPRVRWDIAKTLLAHGAGMVAPKSPEHPDQTPERMRSDDLREIVRLAEDELARRASSGKLIDVTPEKPDSQEVDIFS